MGVSGPLLLLPAIAGLALGSYAATAGLRLAIGKPSSRGRSSCDGCGRRLGFVATTPVVSYVYLRGRCAECAAPIDAVHPAGEVAGAIILVAAFATLPWPAAVLASALGLCLLAASVVDLRTMRLPDGLTAAAAICALALAGLHGPERVVEGMLAAVATFGLLALLRAASAKRGAAAGLGMGDVKLLAALAIWLGAFVSVALVAAALLGLAAAPLLRDREGRLPFGPMIAIAAWVVGLARELGWSPWPT